MTTNINVDSLFLPFRELPGENDVDLSFYQTKDGFYFTPRRHWCFVATITEVENFIRLTLFVRDSNGEEVRIAFHTEARGSEILETYLRPGSTVVVLYAHKHGFLDLGFGIRQEDNQTVKVMTRTYIGILG